MSLKRFAAALRGSSYAAHELPPYMREWQLLKLGISLKEQGYDEPPAVMCDWLIQMETVYKAEKAKAMSGEQ